MKSNVIIIDNQGNGFDKSLEETRKVADYEGLSHKESLQLQLCAEEMLSMARGITGEMQASFWIETEGRTFDLHMPWPRMWTTAVKRCRMTCSAIFRIM